MKSISKFNIDKSLGEIFREYRTIKKLTQEAVAEELEISVKYISRIENGNGGVKIETLVNYMNFLGIPPNILFNDVLTNEELHAELELSKKAHKLSDEKRKFIISVIDLLDENK